jgi:2,4-dienoyl-CoA reductase (NADPH2)
MRHGEQGFVSDRMCGYFRARARGGAALLTIESAPVQRSSRVYSAQLSLYSDDVIPGLARLADIVHGEGALVSQILWHGGRHVPSNAGYAAVAPSPVPSVHTGEVPHELTRAEIAQIVRDHAAAAGRCAKAGLDAVEVQTASDYLYGSFLSPVLNRRTDEYGGSPERRGRIVRETLMAVRETVGDGVAVGLRTSAGHTVPGYGPEDALAAIVAVCDGGLSDWVSVMSGSYWSFDVQIPPMATERPAFADHGRAFRDALDVPIILTGRVRTPEEAEGLLASGAADAVGLARAHIADPEWVTKARRGEARRIRPCVSCNQGCLTFTLSGFPGSCVVNPEAGRELELPPVEQAPARLRVAVVGGGPAGMEAARVAALRGHEVALYESDATLGGTLRVAADCPERGELSEALRWWEGELAALGVEVHTGSPVTDAPAADAVVWAIGAVGGQAAVLRRRPSLVEGIDGSGDLPHGRQVLTGQASVSGNVLVIDEEGGWPAVSLVEWLAADPGVSALTVVTASSHFGAPELELTTELPSVSRRLVAAGVTVHSESLVARVTGGHVQLEGGEELGPFDAIVLSTGAEPRETPAGALLVGDCLAPRGIWAATTDAARLARAL